MRCQVGSNRSSTLTAQLAGGTLVPEQGWKEAARRRTDGSDGRVNKGGDTSLLVDRVTGVPPGRSRTWTLNSQALGANLGR